MSAENDDDDPQMEGTLVDADEYSLRIRDDDRVVTVLRQTVRLEVAMGGPKPIDRRRLAIGAGIGAGAGFVAGGVAGLLLALSRDPTPSSDVDGTVFLGGALVGAGFGALIAHGTRGPAWTEVPLERVHVGLLPAVGRRGFGLTLAVGF